jgi:putative transposase
LRDQPGRFRDFQRVYNEERPHAAHGNAPPAAYYAFAAALGRNPARANLRRVRRNGAIRWRGAEIYLSGRH